MFGRRPSFINLPCVGLTLLHFVSLKILMEKLFCVIFETSSSDISSDSKHYGNSDRFYKILASSHDPSSFFVKCQSTSPQASPGEEIN